MSKLIVLFLFLACNYQVDGKMINTKNRDSIVQSDSDKVIEINKQFEEYKKSFKSITNLLPEESDKLEQVLFVDAREDYEQDVSMISGAITLEEFNKEQNSYRDRNIVVYCTIGYRSGLYTKKLVSKGFSAFNLKGGVLLWSHNKRAFVKGGNSTQKVHVYGKQWDLLESSYKSIY
jgi:sodium/bile acid cotransporter 7